MSILRHPGVPLDEWRRDPVSSLTGNCYRGGFESYRKALLNSTEACDQYHLACFAVVAGLVVGRRAYLPHGGWLFPNLYVVLVGPTGISRKSTAIRFARQMLEGFEVEPITTASWEGLIDHLDENRIALMLPGEFKSLILKARQKSTANLIPGLTELYDCPPTLRHRTRGSNAEVERPFLSILTASTRAWLQESSDESDAAGGFLNRWIYVDGVPKPPMPLPVEPEETHWNEARQALEEMDRWLKGFPLEAGLRLELTTEAQDRWVEFYTELRDDQPRSELLAQLGQRLQESALKMAMLYALLEQSEVIKRDHLDAGISFARWQRKAQARAFEGFGNSKQKKLEDRIVQHLERFHENSRKPKRWELQQAIGGKTSAGEFDYALQALQRNDQLSIDQESKCISLNRS